jgi:hypothetical protein
MSLISYIFIFYIILNLLSRIGNKKRRSYSLMRKEKDNSISVFSEIQDEAGSPGDKINIKQVDSIEKKNNIIIDDKIKEHYPKKKEEILTDKPVVKDREEITSEQESGLGIFLSDNILVNGIILSEIIALPRALRPYDFQRYKRLG